MGCISPGSTPAHIFFIFNTKNGNRSKHISFKIAVFFHMNDLFKPFTRLAKVPSVTQWSGSHWLHYLPTIPAFNLDMTKTEIK